MSERSEPPVHDVIIAGAGPVGLFLACELRLAKLSVLVLERAEEPASPLMRLPFGMRGLWGPSVEAFYRRGLLEAIASSGRSADGGRGQPAPGSMTGAGQRRGPAGHIAGIQFEHANIDPSRWSYRLPGPADSQLGVEMEQLERAQTGTFGLADFDGGAFHRTQPITRAHVETVLRRVSGADVTVTALHLASTWTDRSKQATTYREGRVLLAGDAAHVHSPLGGQGLNLGLGDAMNLGWKLAVTIRGEAAEGLLDSYTTERHPIGARVLEWTRAQVASMRPDRSSRALQAVLRDLID